ncbi:hypothetical protein [Tabrizicola soli]|uniref:DUF721 domain-containing protein n=1 Tax=Tabrizicola soli TaxID=2185115 RepID=A0ABV7DRA7_9RHOB|nr:hypothetical protein [Tabrizicola soli]
MTDLRALVRELLSEEIAAIRAELLGGLQVERVRVNSGADLTDFAQSVARRAQDPAFAAALRDGRLRFELDGPGCSAPAPAPAAARIPVAAQPMALVTTVPAAVPELRKGLITERDIAGIAEGETRLRLTKSARLTPLAGDEARRRGIRIERTLA